MGLYDVGFVRFLFCFGSRMMFACFSICGKCPVASVALYNLARWSPVFLGVCSSISLVISSGPVALLFIFFNVSVISIRVMGVVSVLDFCKLFKLIV